jgi:hypothetical protein
VKTTSRIAQGLLVACLAFAGHAAELELEGPRLLVTGMLDGSSLANFKAHLATGQIRTVVFENSLGGTAQAAGEYARTIREFGVNTEAKGQCHAACAYAFLAGKEHRFGRSFQVHGLLLPLPTRPGPGELSGRWRGEEADRTLAQFFASQDNASATPPPSGAMPVSTTPRDDWRADQGVLFTSTPTLFGRVYNAYYCDGTQGRDMSRCELLSDADPYKLGVLTP